MAHEILDAKISFMSLVDKPANKRKFLIKKQEESEMAKQKLTPALEAEIKKSVEIAVATAVAVAKNQQATDTKTNEEWEKFITAEVEKAIEKSAAEAAEANPLHGFLL